MAPQEERDRDDRARLVVGVEMCDVLDCPGNNRFIKDGKRYRKIDGEKVKLYCGFCVAGTVEMCPIKRRRND